MYGVLVIVGLVASGLAKDLTVGSDGGSLKYDQNITASPTIWRHDRNVTFNVSDSEVITKVDIIDHREDKNGEAAIVEGGEGHKNVTIQLKSPAVFRGFDFEVRVYGKQEDGTQSQQNIQGSFVQDTNVNNKDTPKEVTDEVIKTQSSNNNDQQNINGPFVQDTNVNDKQVPKGVTVLPTQVPNGQDKLHHPIEIGQDKTEHVQRPNRDTQVQGSEQKPLNPTLDTDLKSAKDNKKSNEAQDNQNKGFNPITNDGDWKDMIDNTFTENKPGAQPGVVSTKTNVEPTKPTKDFDNLRQIDANGDGLDVFAIKGSKNVPTSTAKTVEIQQTEKSSQVTKQVNVPLPYVNH